MFKDFTYYPNAMGGFITTFPCMPFIESGQMYDNKTTMTKFKEKNKQYFIENALNDRENTIYQQGSNYQNPGFLMKMTFYKHLPLFIKKKIYHKFLLRLGEYRKFEHLKIEFYENINQIC